MMGGAYDGMLSTVKGNMRAAKNIVPFRGGIGRRALVKLLAEIRTACFTEWKVPTWETVCWINLSFK